MGVLLRPRAWGVRPPPGGRVAAGHPLAAGLVAAYAFNEGGGVTAYNAVGSGQFNGARGSTALWVPQGMTFDGTSNGYVDCGGVTSIGGVTTMDPWTYVFVDVLTSTSQAAGDAVIAGRYDGTTLFQMDYRSASGFVDVIWGSGSFVTVTTGVLSATKPQQFAFTSDLSNVGVVYIDAVSQGTQTPGTGWITATAFRLGMRGGDNAVPWTGRIGGLLLYHRVLKVPELRALMASPWQMFVLPPAHLWVGITAAAATTVQRRTSITMGTRVGSRQSL